MSTAFLVGGVAVGAMPTLLIPRRADNEQERTDRRGIVLTTPTLLGKIAELCFTHAHGHSLVLPTRGFGSVLAQGSLFRGDQCEVEQFG